jgi:hypothetical protein
MAEEIKDAAPVVYLKVKAIPEGLDKRTSKDQSNCTICGIPFSKKGVSQTSKHVW